MLAQKVNGKIILVQVTSELNKYHLKLMCKTVSLEKHRILCQLKQQFHTMNCQVMIK